MIIYNSSLCYRGGQLFSYNYIRRGGGKLRKSKQAAPLENVKKKMKCVSGQEENCNPVDRLVRECSFEPFAASQTWTVFGLLRLKEPPCAVCQRHCSDCAFFAVHEHWQPLGASSSPVVARKRTLPTERLMTMTTSDDFLIYRCSCLRLCCRYCCTGCCYSHWNCCRSEVFLVVVVG